MYDPENVTIPATVDDIHKAVLNYISYNPRYGSSHYDPDVNYSDLGYDMLTIDTSANANANVLEYQAQNAIRLMGVAQLRKYLKKNRIIPKLSEDDTNVFIPDNHFFPLLCILDNVYGYDSSNNDHLSLMDRRLYYFTITKNSGILSYHRKDAYGHRYYSNQPISQDILDTVQYELD